jgi:hypothetical protein
MSSTKAAMVVVGWLVVLTVWTASLTISQVKRSLEDREPPGLSTQWENDGIRVMGRDGRCLVTHLENVENGSMARLPEPVWVVESGGVLISKTNLAKLEWKLPAAGPFEDVFALTIQLPPKAGRRVEALYQNAVRARFVERK